jgi:hypothetical protein
MKSDQANSFQRVKEAAPGAFDDHFMDRRVPGTPHNKYATDAHPASCRDSGERRTDMRKGA